MIYAIITRQENATYIQNRISVTGWPSIKKLDTFFVNADKGSAVEVYDTLVEENVQLSGTIVVKISDNEQKSYWGRSDSEFWDWWKQNARLPHSQWDRE